MNLYLVQVARVDNLADLMDELVISAPDIPEALKKAREVQKRRGITKHVIRSVMWKQVLDA